MQWSGSSPPDPTNWDTITYTYDPAGRRIKKNVVGSYIVKYVYDGDHVIAEYDDSGLLRKYIYGARVDEPVCMIDVADNNKAYYYHFDGLGSVVALSNSNGDSCQSYEYSAYGQVAASDPNHTNPYMFTGRRFDIETGLYYYRARYYNPHIGRFMQTDPVGYAFGINWYLYCWNNPLSWVDSSGLEPKRTHDEDGWIKDVWSRPKGHPDPAGFPGYNPMPYYVQQQGMDCVPVAVLNWWLTYNKELPTTLLGLNNVYDTDYEAEKYVCDKFDGYKFHDWNKKGIGNLFKPQSVIDPSRTNTTHNNTKPKSSDIWSNVVTHEKAIMTAYNTNSKGEAWHCILIVPTPVDYIDDVGTAYEISVIDATHDRPYTFTKTAFTAWWDALYKEGRVAHEYLVGNEKIPGRN